MDNKRFTGFNSRMTVEPFPPKRTTTKSYIIHELPKRVADTYLCQDHGKLKLNYIQLRRPHKMPFIWENYIKLLQRRTYLSKTHTYTYTCIPSILLWWT